MFCSCGPMAVMAQGGLQPGSSRTDPASWQVSDEGDPLRNRGPTPRRVQAARGDGSRVCSHLYNVGSLGPLGNWEEERDGSRPAGTARLGTTESHRLSTLRPPGAVCAIFIQKHTEQVCGTASAKQPRTLNSLKKASSCRKYCAGSKRHRVPVQAPDCRGRAEQRAVWCPG